MRVNVETVEREMIFNAKTLSGNRAKASEGKEVVLLSGLSRSVKANESPVQCEWGRAHPPRSSVNRSSVSIQLLFLLFLFF